MCDFRMWTALCGLVVICESLVVEMSVVDVGCCR